MSQIRCERCGKEINYDDAHVMKIEHRGRVNCTYMCEDCADLTKQFTEPAYIPGYSKTRYDILCNQMKAKLEMHPKYQIREMVKNLMIKKRKVNKVAAELGITPESVMLIIKDIEEEECLY